MKGKNTDRSMKSSLSTEKLDRNNCASWAYKMHQYLLGHRYWSYIEGANKAALELMNKDFLDREQGSRDILYCLAFGLHDQMLSYIKDAKLPKDAWENLKRVFTANTTTRKLQLCQELNDVRQGGMSVIDDTTKIKEICDSLSSISLIVDEEHMVQICFSDLAQKYRWTRIAIYTREKPLLFFGLWLMLLEE